MPRTRRLALTIPIDVRKEFKIGGALGIDLYDGDDLDDPDPNPPVNGDYW